MLQSHRQMLVESCWLNCRSLLQSKRQTHGQNLRHSLLLPSHHQHNPSRGLAALHPQCPLNNCLEELLAASKSRHNLWHNLRHNLSGLLLIAQEPVPLISYCEQLHPIMPAPRASQQRHRQGLLAGSNPVKLLV